MGGARHPSWCSMPYIDNSVVANSPIASVGESGDLVSMKEVVDLVDGEV